MSRRKTRIRRIDDATKKITDQSSTRMPLSDTRRLSSVARLILFRAGELCNLQKHRHSAHQTHHENRCTDSKCNADLTAAPFRLQHWINPEQIRYSQSNSRYANACET